MDKIITVLGYKKFITEMSDAPDWSGNTITFNNITCTFNTKNETKHIFVLILHSLISHSPNVIRHLYTFIHYKISQRFHF